MIRGLLSAIRRHYPGVMYSVISQGSVRMTHFLNHAASTVILQQIYQTLIPKPSLMCRTNRSRQAGDVYRPCIKALYTAATCKTCIYRLYTAAQPRPPGIQTFRGFVECWISAVRHPTVECGINAVRTPRLFL